VRTEARRRLLVLLAAALCVAACTTGRAGLRGGLRDEEVSALPPPVAESYQLFASRCSRCHTLARPLDARITDRAHWRAYVERMRKTPGSGISERDASEIMIFLGHRADTLAKRAPGGEP
jgi:hypothetical protein